VSFSVLFVCICVLNYCHRVATQLQLNISYRIQYVEQGRQLYVRVTIVALEKQYVLHILSVSVALVIQHAKRMRRIISLSVACLALQYFSILSHKLYNLLIKKLLTIKRVF